MASVVFFSSPIATELINVIKRQNKYLITASPQNPIVNVLHTILFNIDLAIVYAKFPLKMWFKSFIPFSSQCGNHIS